MVHKCTHICTECSYIGIGGEVGESLLVVHSSDLLLTVTVIRVPTHTQWWEVHYYNYRFAALTTCRLLADVTPQEYIALYVHFKAFHTIYTESIHQ